MVFAMNRKLKFDGSIGDERRAKTTPTPTNRKLSV
jgi:hypothetical protein